MPKQLTWWLHEFQSSSLRGLHTYEEVCNDLLELDRPNGWSVGLMVKGHSGNQPQAAFDAHPLAINGSNLQRLKEACDKAGVALGVWGEPRGDAVGSGTIAGVLSRITGYYAADVEPYSDFRIPNQTTGDSAAVIASYAVEFWRAYRAANGAADPGITVAPQPSGLDPFGWEGWLAWFAPVTWLQPQCYYAANAPQLHPDVAIPTLVNRLDSVGLFNDWKLLPIFTPSTWREQAKDGKWLSGVDVWAL